MTHDEMIEVIQAHKDGKKIEFSCDDGITWERPEYPSWSFYDTKYRVAQDPRTVRYLAFSFADGSVCWSLENSDSAKGRAADGARRIHQLDKEVTL